MQPRFAIIIPACDEAEALPQILLQLASVLDPQDYVIAVGANGCRDATAEIARAGNVTVGETEKRGYGYGCQVAIDAVNAVYPALDGYIFFAADGANDPREIAKLVATFDEGHDFVLGQRTHLRANRRTMTRSHIFANRVLGFWCGILTGRFFSDLGPMRLIARPVFERLALREWTYGWTIEPQILIARLGLPSYEIDVREYPRIAGEQKVSQVNWRRTLQIGGQILAAGWRSRLRTLPQTQPCQTPRFVQKDSPNPV